MTETMRQINAAMDACKEAAGRLMVRSAELLEQARRMERRLKRPSTARRSAQEELCQRF